ncbi:MAG: hypothetical protein IBX60_03600 [Candidatus Aminicenantes bacterium]|nr:hypothetical protein [Candidatus Aminicenantes bacterium]
MHKQFSAMIILIGFFFANISFSYGLQANEDISLLLNNAIQAFTSADFEGSVNILNKIKSQPDILKNISPKDRETLEFYLSYSLYLLYGLSDQRTYRAICDLKLHSPNFSPDKKEYSWISNDWIAGWKNINCYSYQTIKSTFDRGKELYDQNFPILGAQEFINILILSENSKNLQSGCPECQQYINLSHEYLTLCEKNMINIWDGFFNRKNFDECINLEQRLANINRDNKYFLNVKNYLDEKKTEIISSINDSLSEYRNEINKLMTSTELIDVDTAKLENSWKELKIYKDFVNNESFFNSEKLLQEFNAISLSIIDEFKRYGDYVNSQFVIQQEERVLQSVENYKKCLMDNFPEFIKEIEQEYVKIVNASPPIFTSTAVGVKPAKASSKWIVPYPECLKISGIKGQVRLGIVIDTTGKVEDVRIVSKNFNTENDCLKDFISNLEKYISGKKYKPAVKLKNSPAYAPFNETKNLPTINVKYYSLMKFVVE